MDRQGNNRRKDRLHQDHPTDVEPQPMLSQLDLPSQIAATSQAGVLSQQADAVVPVVESLAEVIGAGACVLAPS